MTPERPDLPDSWNADESGPKRSKLWLVGGALLVVLIVAGIAFVATHKDALKEQAWPNSVNGRPPGLGEFKQAASKVDVKAKPGVYVWSDFDGWHVWTVNGGDIAGVKGTITSNKDFGNADLAVKGAGTVSLSGSTITFEVPSEPQLVGIDFNTGFYGDELTLDLQGANGPLSPTVVTKGSSSKVTKLPLVIKKVPKDEAAQS